MMKKCLLCCICLAIIMFMLSGCVCIPTRVPEEYQSRMTAYVNNRSIINDSYSSISATDITASQRLVDTYLTIIQSSKVRNEVIALSGISSEFTVEVNSLNETEVFEIVVKSPDAQIAYDVCCAYAEVIPHVVEEIIDGSSLRIIDVPQMPKEPSAYKWSWFK